MRRYFVLRKIKNKAKLEEIENVDISRSKD